LSNVAVVAAAALGDVAAVEPFFHVLPAFYCWSLACFVVCVASVSFSVAIEQLRQ